MTTVEADLLARESSEVSHLGCCVSARPVLKVVSSVAMVAKEWEVGMPWTRSWLAGESSWTVVVPGIKWRKADTLLLSEVALTESMVVRVTLPPSKETVCTRVAERALLMLSLSSIAVGRSGEPSRLMVSLLSLIVGPFLGAGVLAEVGAATGVVPDFGGAEAFFLPFLATIAHDGAGTAGVTGGGGGYCWGAGREVDFGGWVVGGVGVEGSGAGCGEERRGSRFTDRAERSAVSVSRAMV